MFTSKKAAHKQEIPKLCIPHFGYPAAAPKVILDSRWGRHSFGVVKLHSEQEAADFEKVAIYLLYPEAPSIFY